jgi:hypothetical protein
MRVPLVVATVAASFSLALLFQSSLRVYSLTQHEPVSHPFLLNGRVRSNNTDRSDQARIKQFLMFPGVFLALSGLTFVVAFLVSPWVPDGCDSGCRTAGVVAERTLVMVVMAGGFGTIYFLLQRERTSIFGISP